MISSCMKISHIHLAGATMGIYVQTTNLILVACLEDFTTPVSEPPTVDAMILDGAEVVHQLDPRTARTFSDYADTVFIPTQ